MLALLQYGSSDEDNAYEDKHETEESISTEPNHLEPIENTEYSIKSQLQICAAPLVVPTVSLVKIINI